MGGEEAWWDKIPDWAKMITPAFGPPGGFPSFQHGGIVPGPIGQPVPIMAHGGEQFLGSSQSAGGINIHIGSFLGDESSLREFARIIKDTINQDTRRTSFAGVNTLGYFGGSSAP